jgi:hypothetical protein
VYYVQHKRFTADLLHVVVGRLADVSPSKIVHTGNQVISLLLSLVIILCYCSTFRRHFREPGRLQPQRPEDGNCQAIILFPLSDDESVLWSVHFPTFRRAWQYPASMPWRRKRPNNYLVSFVALWHPAWMDFFVEIPQNTVSLASEPFAKMLLKINILQQCVTYSRTTN